MDIRGRRRHFSDTPISVLIRASNLSDEDFAALTGAKKRTVISWRRGDKTPPTRRLLAIVKTVEEKLGPLGPEGTNFAVL